MKSCSSRPSSLSKRHRLAAAVLLCALVACQPGEVEPLTPRVPAESPSSTKTLIVGLVGTMSGPDAWRGDDAFEGADLAVHELNRSRRQNAPMYELVTLDDRGDASEATRLVQQLAGSTRTVGIVYAGPPEGLPPAEGALAASGIPAILCYGDLYGAQLLSPHVFQASPSFLWEARRIARYLTTDRGYRRVGLMSERDLTGRTARQTVTLALQESGRRLTAAASYAPSGAGVDAALDEMRRRRIQAVVVQASPPAAARILRSLRAMGARYRDTRSARSAGRGARRWAPQIVGLDLVMSPSLSAEDLSAGTVVADTYARGAHYLPIPSFEGFRSRFFAWWDSAPLGWEQRAYDAARMIGWAAQRVQGDPTDAEVALELEKMRRVRFAGLDITMGPDDHTAVDQTTVGLWVVPRAGIDVAERSLLPDRMPWVPLGRGFSIDGEGTDVLSRDWKFLFENAPPPKAPAPPISRAHFGVTTSARDPIH